MNELRDNRRAWGMLEVLALSWPASVSMLNSTLMRFVDGLMISYVGPIPLAAQMLGGLAAFVPESFGTGLLGVVNTYVAQNFGASRHGRCGQYAWAGVLIALALCLLISPLILAARGMATWGPLQDWMRQSPETIDLEVMYFQFMVGAVFLTMTARPLEQFFYGIGRPRVVLLASIISNLANIVLGYLLIFGRGGFIILLNHPFTRPAGEFLMGLPLLDFEGRGLYGAAVANIISWGIHLTILTIIFLRKRISDMFATRRPRLVRLAECLDICRIGWPAGLQFINDMLPWTLLLWVLVGRFGEIHIAASSIAMRWMPLSFMPAVGIGVATTALVGKYIGQGRPDIARRRAHAALALALAYMGVCGLAFFFLRDPMVRMFVTILPIGDVTTQQAVQDAEEIIRIGGYVMICAAIFQLFDAVGIVLVGALRGAGDTFWPMVLTIAGSWGITVGGGFIMVEAWPGLASIGPWITASLYVVVLGVMMVIRFELGRWQRIRLLK